MTTKIGGNLSIIGDFSNKRWHYPKYIQHLSQMLALNNVVGHYSSIKETQILDFL